MNDLRIKEQADSTLRWGGLAGILGSLLMIFTFGFTAAFVGVDISPEQSLTRFPEIRAARTVENSLYLVILLLWVIHSLALYRALRRTSPTPALFGTVLSILGLAVLAAGALPHVATAPLSDLYQAPGVTAQDQATLVLAWHAIEAMFDALLFTGLVILPLGLIALGTAMLGAPDYGKRIGGTTVALGVAGLAAATAVLVGVPAIAAVGVFALIGFHLTLGWKTRKLARGTTFQDVCRRLTRIAWANETPAALNDVGAWSDAPRRILPDTGGTPDKRLAARRTAVTQAGRFHAE